MKRAKQMTDDLDEEIRDHIAMETQDNIDRGMPPEEARYAALRKFGNVTRVLADTRAVWSSMWLEQVLQDIRFGFRMLRKSPVFSAVAILTLALGIGANTAIFSLINAVMLRALPVRDPSQLVLLKWNAHKVPNLHGMMTSGDCRLDLRFDSVNPSGCSFSEPMFREIEQAKIFSGTAAFANAGRINLTGRGPASVIEGQLVSGDFFRVMGLLPAAGRLLNPNDDAPSAAPVAILNYGYWQSAFGGAQDVLGQTIELNKVAFTVVGVAEPRFNGITPGSDYDVWLPLSAGQLISSTGPFRWNGRQDDVAMWWLTIVGRLNRETSTAKAQTIANGLFRNQVLNSEVPMFRPGEMGELPLPLPARAKNTAPTQPNTRQNPHFQGPGMRPVEVPSPVTTPANTRKTVSAAADNPTITLVSAQTGLSGRRSQYSDPLYLLMLAVGIILFIACANVAGLMLARAAARRKEMAVRLTLGAGPARLFCQLLAECVLLSMIGGVFGILFAYWGAHAIISFVANNQMRPLGFATGVDLRVLGFTAAISLLTGIVFGIVPAFRSTRVAVTPALKEGEGGSGGFVPARGLGPRWLSGRWLSAGRALVMIQVALAIVVLVGAGLLVRTLANLRSVDVGFDSHNVMTFAIDPSKAGYKDAQIDAFYRDLQGRLTEIPGVASVSYSLGSLLDNGLMVTAFHWPGTPQSQQSESDMLPVGPEFFKTMKIPVLEGRHFQPPDFALSIKNMGDTPTQAPTPVIVNQTFIAKYLGHEAPLGKRWGQSEANEPGPARPGYEIVGVVRDIKHGDLRREIHPMMFSPQPGGGATFELRTEGPPETILPAVRKIVAGVNANLPLFDVVTESQQIDRLLFQERLVARFASFFGILALVLACIGLYGLLSYEVTRRTREIGIRMALGAQAAQVSRLIIRQGIGLALLGALIGIGVALAVTRYLSSMLYAVQANDPLTLISMAGLLTLVALAACYIPARRAMRVDPMVALRYE